MCVGAVWRRRDVGSMSMADLLFIVLVADASSSAMQGEYKSITNGVALLGTLIAWNYLLDVLAYRYELVARTLSKERITVDELMGKLREEGVDDLGMVRIARLESDGKVSVIRNE